jgi:hypothetical protein
MIEDRNEDKAERNEGTLFKFAIEQRVRIVCSGEIGEVIGRAQYKNSTNQYLVRYQAADGRATEQWWSYDALRAN